MSCKTVTSCTSDSTYSAAFWGHVSNKGIGIGKTGQIKRQKQKRRLQVGAFSLSDDQTEMLACGFAFLHFLNHLIRHVSWAWCVVRELHGKLAATRCHGAQITDVAKHFC